MESLGPLMRKFDFPQSVCEALKIIHIQCEKMSLNPSSALSQVNNCKVVVSVLIKIGRFYLYEYLKMKSNFSAHYMVKDLLDLTLS